MLLYSTKTICYANLSQLERLIMDPLGKKELLHFYNMHLRDFGDVPQAVRWTPEGRVRRYERLLTIAGGIAGKEILDFGCGKGDFYGFLKEKGISINYCGLDINENLIALAKSKYPESEFISMDIEEENFNREFDIIFICGVFNLRVAGIEESMKNVLKRLLRLCREAIYLNVLTYYVPQRNVELFYVKPEEILQFALNELSRNVILRHEKEDIYLSIFFRQ
ncbi:MAG: class I SAM-dependent methyltransferase [Nitrospirota bacterium]